MEIINIINAETGVINSFTENEFENLIGKNPINISNYKNVDKKIREIFEESKSDALLFYENDGRTYPIKVFEEDFNNYIRTTLSIENLRKKYFNLIRKTYKIRLSSKDDMPKRSTSRDDDEIVKKNIREEIQDPKLIMEGKELSESKQLGEGAYGSVFYDHKTKTITKISNLLGTTLLEFIAIKENPMFKDHDYRLELKDNGQYIIKSKISGEQILDKIQIPKDDEIKEDELNPMKDLYQLLFTNINSRKIARLILDMCLQLKYLHYLGIYHRDIKGANTLVSKQGKNYIAHFIDFGLAYIDVGQDDKNKHAISVYCAEYTNPNFVELNQKKDIEKSDVCGLGFGIIYWLTQKRMFPFSNSVNIEYNLVRAEYIIDKKQGMTAEEKKAYHKKLYFLGEKPLELYTVETATKENFTAELISELNDIPSLEMIDFLWNMCNPNIKDRFTVEKLLRHPYLSSYAYNDYTVMYPRTIPPSKDVFILPENASTTLKKYLNGMKRLENLSINIYHHTVNLISRYLNFLRNQNKIQDGYLRSMGQACLIISICRLSDYFMEIRSDIQLLSYITNSNLRDVFAYITQILNKIDCRCGIYESEVYNFPIEVIPPKPVIQHPQPVRPMARVSENMGSFFSSSKAPRV